MEDHENLDLILAMLEEEEEEEEAALQAIALVEVAEIMALEEGEVVDLDSWVHVTVNIDEYFEMPDSVFRLHFRMTKPVFESITTTVKNHLRRTGKLKRERTPFRNIMLMVLWIIATPDSFRSVALRFGVRPGTLHYFYTYVIEALKDLAASFIKWPDAEERRVIKETFQRATGFPGVIGSIDCTHVYITAPLHDANQYTNRHHSYSINVQAVVDNNLEVRHLHVGEVGSMNDARVFRRSSLHHDLLHSEPGVVLDADEHLVGDGAYTVTSFMLTPFENNGHLTPRQKNFNKRLSQARVRVENGFGLAKGKWRRLKFLHARNARYVVDHITASFVLHNMLIQFGENLFDEEELGRPIYNNQILGRRNFNNQDNLEDMAEVERQILEGAEAVGEEKRIMIMEQLHNDN